MLCFMRCARMSALRPWNLEGLSTDNNVKPDLQIVQCGHALSMSSGYTRAAMVWVSQGRECDGGGRAREKSEGKQRKGDSTSVWGCK